MLGSESHYMSSDVLSVGHSRSLDFSIASLEGKSLAIFDEGDNLVIATENYKRILSKFSGIRTKIKYSFCFSESEHFCATAVLRGSNHTKVMEWPFMP